MQNVKTRWINMFSLVEHVLSNNINLWLQICMLMLWKPTLLMKISTPPLQLGIDSKVTCHFATLGFYAHVDQIFPISWCTHMLFYWMKVYQLEFYHIYNDPYTKINNPTFETNELNVFETLIVDENTLRCF